MFRAFTILSAIVSASAFAPSSRAARASSLKMGYETAPGVTSPGKLCTPLV